MIESSASLKMLKTELRVVERVIRAMTAGKDCPVCEQAYRENYITHNLPNGCYHRTTGKLCPAVERCQIFDRVKQDLSYVKIQLQELIRDHEPST